MRSNPAAPELCSDAGQMASVTRLRLCQIMITNSKVRIGAAHE